MSRDTAEWYRRFAVTEARGESARYEVLAAGVAGDPALLALLDQLPAVKRQPNLLLAAVRFLGGAVESYPAFAEWTVRQWPAVRATITERRTQTNEPGRCAVLLPLLASLPQPLALIEVGASAGLCLYPDRYRYRYDDGPILGPANGPVLSCRTSGPVPSREPLPTVLWRAGIDINPLDLHDPEDVRWLESLVWPEQTDRLDRLRGAVECAKAEPPYLIRGDLNQTIRDLVARVPAGATPVVFHSAVLAYLEADDRDSFVETIRALGVRWISNEAPSVLRSVAADLTVPVPSDRAVFVLALDGQPMAFSGPHGQTLDWFSERGAGTPGRA